MLFRLVSSKVGGGGGSKSGVHIHGLAIHWLMSACKDLLLLLLLLLLCCCCYCCCCTKICCCCWGVPYGVTYPAG